MKAPSKDLFSGTIPVTRPWFTEEEEGLLLETLRSGWVAQGPRVRLFEETVARYAGVSDAIAVSSCTAALALGLEIFDVGPGDEVILPSFTFIAGGNVVLHRGARPVFVDIDPKTYNLDPDAVEAAVTGKTKVILAVDQIGLPAELDRLHAIAGKKGIKLLEDAACALGSEYHGKKIGAVSEMSCLSFHPRKLITTGEGGMLLTPKKEFAEAARSLITHGASISALARHESGRNVAEEYRTPGYNFRMSDLQAAVGVAQMKKLDEILRKKRALAQRYSQAFRALPELVPPFEPEGTKHNFQSYLLRLLPRARKSRNELMEGLQQKGISTRRGIMAIHREPAYRDRFGPFELPETERATDETLILPLYPQMTPEEQDHVIDSIREILAS